MNPKKEAHEETDHILAQAVSLLDTIYDFGMESRALGNSDPEAVQIMTLIQVAREKAHAAQDAHQRADWN